MHPVWQGDESLPALHEVPQVVLGSQEATASKGGAIVKLGRKPDPVKWELMERYSLTRCQRKALTMKRIEQLQQCKDEAARRLILGVSR